MGDWSSNEILLIAQTNGKLITPGATAHTKSAFVTSDYSSNEAFGFTADLLGGFSSNTTARTVMTDIYVDDQPVIENLAFCPGGFDGGSLFTGGMASQLGNQSIFFPLKFPSGTAKYRAQSSMASHPSISFVQTVEPQNGRQLFSSCYTYGANTATTRGVSVTRIGNPWVEITAASNKIGAFIVFVGHGNLWQQISSSSAQAFSIDIGMGPVGSEVVIATLGGSTTKVTGLPNRQWFGPFFADIPDGSRLSARLTYGNNLTYYALDVIIYGLG